MLHDIVGSPSNRKHWCGPSALAAITGLNYMAALGVFQNIRGPNRVGRTAAIMGVHNPEMMRALTRAGYRTQEIGFARGATLARFLRERTDEQRSSTILVNAGHHYVVVKGNKGIDNKTKTPVFISKMPGRRMRMARAWIVTKVAPAAKPMAPVIVAQQAEAAKAAKAKLAEQGRIYREVRALCTQHGFKIVKHSAGDYEIMAERDDYWISDELSGRFSDGYPDILEYLQWAIKNNVLPQPQPEEEDEKELVCS